MIELSVSLASNGAVKLAGYEQMLRFGYSRNCGVYRLRVSAADEWKGMTLRAFWHTPGGSPPASLVEDGVVEVPALVTAVPGEGCITFEGSDGVRTLTSADLRYRVAANSGTEDGTEPEPGTPAWQAFVEAVKESAASAEQSKTEALDAAERAGASADEAAASAASALESAESAEKNALSSATSAAEATRQAELAAQAAESKGFLYLEDDDNSGTLSLVVSDNLTNDVTLQDDGQGNLEVVYK
jgi:hypothetical protein